MGSFGATLLTALLSAGVSPERAQAVVEQFDGAIDERIGLHGHVLATKRDLADVQLALTDRIAECDRHVVDLHRQLAQTSERIAGVDAGVHERIAGVHQRIAETKAELVRWAFGALTAQTALVIGAFKLL